MRLPFRDYVALGLVSPAFAFRWANRKWWNKGVGAEDRHHQMLSYLMLMGYDYDGYNLSTYDDARTNHVFWCGNWPYAYGLYAMVYDDEHGVKVLQYGVETASLRNVILCRKMERQRWAADHTTGPNPSHTVRGVLTGWALYWAGWLRSILSSKTK